MKNEFLESVMSLDIIGEYGYSAGYRDIPSVFDTLHNGFNIDEFDKVIQDNLPVIPGVEISYQKADNLRTLSATKGNHQYALEVCLKQGVINFIGRESMEYGEGDYRYVPVFAPFKQDLNFLNYNRDKCNETLLKPMSCGFGRTTEILARAVCKLLEDLCQYLGSSADDYAFSLFKDYFILWHGTGSSDSTDVLCLLNQAKLNGVGYIGFAAREVHYVDDKVYVVVKQWSDVINDTVYILSFETSKPNLVGISTEAIMRAKLGSGEIAASGSIKPRGYVGTLNVIHPDRKIPDNRIMVAIYNALDISTDIDSLDKIIATAQYLCPCGFDATIHVLNYLLDGIIRHDDKKYDEGGKLHEVNANRKWGLAPYWINRVQDGLYLTTVKEGNREVKYHQSVGVITVPVLNIGSDEEPYIKLMVIAEVTQDHAARGTGGEYGCNASARWRIPFNEESIAYINQLMDKVDDALFNDDCTVNVNGLRELMTELKGMC